MPTAGAGIPHGGAAPRKSAGGEAPVVLLSRPAAAAASSSSLAAASSSSKGAKKEKKEEKIPVEALSQQPQPPPKRSHKKKEKPSRGGGPPKKEGGGSGNSGSGNNPKKSGRAVRFAADLAPVRDPVPAVGDPCCVYLEQCSDFFRPRIFDDRLGGWHPARVVQVERLGDAAALGGGGGGPAKKKGPASGSNSSICCYQLTVRSDFFTGKKRFRFPSDRNQILLMEPSDEDYASLSLRGDPRNVVFQAQPQVLHPGDLVFARYQAADRWHRGRVVAVYPEELEAAPASSGSDNNNGGGSDERKEAELMPPPPPPAVAAAGATGTEEGGGAATLVVAGGANGESSEETKEEEATPIGTGLGDAATAAAEAAAATAPAECEAAEPAPVPSSLAAAATAVATSKKPRRYLCSIAYDGGGDNGRATLETHVPFGDGSNEKNSISGRDISDEDDEAERDKPYVYLAQRGRDDVRWLQLELERMFDFRELLPLSPDQQVPEKDGEAADPASSSSSRQDVLPVALQQLAPAVAADAAATAAAGGKKQGQERVSLDRSSLEYLYFRYDDVVRCVFEVAAKRHGNSLLEIEWPSQPRIQKSGASRKRNKKKK